MNMQSMLTRGAKEKEQLKAISKTTQGTKRKKAKA